jgi:hypothetical protein
MTAGLVDSPRMPLRGAPFGRRTPRGRPAGGRRVTLEERLQTVWRAAQQEGFGECPVCRATMRAEGATARCHGCGSVLA